MASPLQGTRLQLLAIIREQGSASVEQLSQESGLSSATVRRHLDILQRDHLVSCRESRKRLGRPEHLYSLTESGHEAGQRNYQTLLILLLDALRQLPSTGLSGKEGDELLEHLMVQVADRLSAPSRDNSSSKESRVARLEETLRDNGFEPQIHRTNGHVEIRLCNCPFRAAALCEKSICLADQRLIANVLGVDPTRQTSIREGEPVCSYTARLDD